MTTDSTNAAHAIEVSDVIKSYRDSRFRLKSVLNDVSLKVKKGEVFGFLGPNGAGKTTLIKILVGLVKSQGGTCKIFGHKCGTVEANRKVGFLPENPYFHHFLTAEEFLRFHGHLLGLDADVLDQRIPKLLDKVRLKKNRDDKLRTFSKGMLQRAGFAQALLAEPDLLILDEPMTGLDPVGRREMRDMINEAALAGKTVFFSTHILADVEVICTNVGFINQGKLKGSGNIEELLGKTVRSMEVRFELPFERDAHAIKAFSEARRTMDGWVLDVETEAKSLEEDVNEILKTIHKEKGVVRSVIPRKSTLEDLFFNTK